MQCAGWTQSELPNLLEENRRIHRLLTEVNTPALFGHSIGIYDISRAVEDGATVLIYYESRLARIELDDGEKLRIDAEIEALWEDQDEPSAECTKQKWSTVEALVGSVNSLTSAATTEPAQYRWALY